MAEGKIKVIVENHQSGNRQFPGWKKKYRKLFDIPGEAFGERAVIETIDKEDLDDIMRDFIAEGVSVRDAESIDDDSKGFFGRLFPKLFPSWVTEEESGTPSDDPRTQAFEQWETAFKQLSRNQKKQFKDFDADKAGVEELQAKTAEVQKLITPEE